MAMNMQVPYRVMGIFPLEFQPETGERIEFAEFFVYEPFDPKKGGVGGCTRPLRCELAFAKPFIAAWPRGVESVEMVLELQQFTDRKGRMTQLVVGARPLKQAA